MEAVAVTNLESLSETERMIFKIVAELLGTETFDIQSNFFDIGITSLNLVTINNRLKKQLEKEIPLTALFEHTSVELLADYLDHMDDQDEEEEVDSMSEEEYEEQVSILSGLMDDED